MQASTGETMLAVEFHTGLSDPLAYACRMLRKAQRQGLRVLVTAPKAELAELDRLLWTFDSASFVPHISLPSTLAAQTPIWLCSDLLSADWPDGDAPPVLINLGAPAAAQPLRFERLIELVGLDVDQAAAGRERWREYKAQGLAIVHHKPGMGAEA